VSLPFSNMLGLALGVLIFVVGLALSCNAHRMSLRAAWSIGVAVFLASVALLTVTIRYEASQARQASVSWCTQESPRVWRCEGGGG
jgi:hypothetical protein